MKKTAIGIDRYELAQDFLKETAIGGQPTRWFWRGGWYVWSGTHYQQVGQEFIERDVLQFLRDKTVAVINVGTIRGVVDLLRLLQVCEVQQAPAWIQGHSDLTAAQLFPVKNGLLRLRENYAPEVLPHTPAFWGLSASDFLYSKDASCCSWNRFLDQLWSDDFQTRSVLQEWVGYCLLPNTSQQKILAIMGPPRSGKSTIGRVLTELLGRQNVASPSIRSLSGQFGLWGMLDKSLAIIPDATLPKPCPALEELLKSISGEDSVDIHRKGMPPLTGIRLPTRLMLLANEPPTFHDPSGALERRLIVLRTERSFFNREDIQLTNRLLEELPGILNWAIEGLERLWNRGHFPETRKVMSPEKILDNLPTPDRVSRIVITYDRPDRKRRRPYRSPSPKRSRRQRH